jgi:hypothetical protein
MKNLKTLAFAIALMFTKTFTFAQIVITPTGDTKVGNERIPNDYNNEAVMEVFSLNNDTYRGGARLAIGDYGSSPNYSANVYIGEAWGWDSDQLDVHGKNGIYFTIGGNDNIIGAELQLGGHLRVTGNVYSSHTLLYSDIRLKKNIKNLTSALASIQKIQGISYDFKNDNEDKVLEKLSKTEIKDEKSKLDLEKMKKVYEDKKADNLNQMGFSAQDIQKVFPQMVKADENGILTVNYTALTPVLVEAIKEQQTVIEAQKAEIEAMKKDITAIKKKIGL